MKAGMMLGSGQTPIYGDFDEPKAQVGEELVTVTASALSHLAKGRAQGSHYSASGTYPLVIGVDGVGHLADGKKVYFMLPRAPFGALSEKTVVKSSFCLPLPEGLNEPLAAGLANPGMSCWMALKERAKFVAGETVLINGATGTAGSLAVQVAKYLGAKKVIATGRNPESLQKLKALGADETISILQEDTELEKIYQDRFAEGVNVVLDYLWGATAERLLIAAAKADNEEVPLRFVHIGAVAGRDITLPGAVLRAIPIQLMGSGLGSVPLERIALVMRDFFAAAVPGNFQVDIKTWPLEKIAEAWAADTGNPRTVLTIS